MPSTPPGCPPLAPASTSISSPPASWWRAASSKRDGPVAGLRSRKSPSRICLMSSPAGDTTRASAGPRMRPDTPTPVPRALALPPPGGGAGRPRPRCSPQANRQQRVARSHACERPPHDSWRTSRAQHARQCACAPARSSRDSSSCRAGACRVQQRKTAHHMSMHARAVHSTAPTGARRALAAPSAASQPRVHNHARTSPAAPSAAGRTPSSPVATAPPSAAMRC